MKKIYIAIISLLLSDVGLQAQEQDTVRLTLKEAIRPVFISCAFIIWLKLGCVIPNLEAISFNATCL